MKQPMTDEQFADFVLNIDSDILPVRSRLTKEEEEKARRDYSEWQKDWTEHNAE